MSSSEPALGAVLGLGLGFPGGLVDQAHQRSRPQKACRGEHEHRVGATDTQEDAPDAWAEEDGRTLDGGGRGVGSG